MTAVANKMKYVRLGKSGLKTSAIILGCMSYGVRRPKDNWTWVLEEEEALKHLKVSDTIATTLFDADIQFAYDNGINVSCPSSACGKSVLQGDILTTTDLRYSRYL